MEQMQKDGKKLHPDSHSFDHAIVCWLRSGVPDAAIKVVELLDKMEEIESGNKKTQNLLHPRVFEIILRGFSKDVTTGNREAAKLVLERMILLSKENTFCKPTPTILNLALKSECTESNRKPNEMAAFDAHRLLFDFIKRHRTGEIDVLPDVVGFNTVISCWANTRHRAVVSKADEIFEAMEKLSKIDGLEYIKPDAYTYSTMMNVYAKSSRRDATKKAEALVEKIKQNGDTPDNYTYNGLLNVWARSKNSRKAVHAQNILKTMINKNLAETLSFNIVLKACAQTRGSKENEKYALEVAQKTYQDLIASQEMKHDQVSFATAIKSIHYLSENKEEREHFFRLYFDDCCKHGLLSRLVVKEIKNAIPEKDRLSILGHKLVSPFKKDWIRNL